MRSITLSPIRFPVITGEPLKWTRRLMHHFSVSSLDEVRKCLGVDLSYIYASGIIYEDRKGLFGPTPRYFGPESALSLRTGALRIYGG